MTYRQPSYQLHRRWARETAYKQLTPQEQTVIDALMYRVQANVPRAGAVVSYEIIAAIGELLAEEKASA